MPPARNPNLPWEVYHRYSPHFDEPDAPKLLEFTLDQKLHIERKVSKVPADTPAHLAIYTISQY
jgi:hypothetical protein